MSHPLKTLLNPAPYDTKADLARELQELKSVLAPFLDPDHKSGIPMRIQFAPKPDTENVQTQSQGETQ